ncbi:MAG TPA: hypothetical protein V6D48_22730 [Oculatellaceae cyanobacterium]
MVQPTLKPTDSLQMLERHHHDPPALWFAVTVGSFLIHLLAFGILRLLLMGGSQGLQARKAIVPVEVIVVARKTTSTTQIAQQPRAVTTTNPTAVNPPIRRKVNPSQNPSATRANQQPTKRSPISSQNKPSKTPIQKPAVKVSPSVKDRKSPVANSSSNQQPQPRPPSTNPVSPTDNTPKPNPYPNPSPSPKPNPYPNPSPSPKPNPYPNPSPSPKPKPSPSPSPSPKPSPSPSPSPSPQPSPSPSPSPKPSPSPTPEPPTLGGSISLGQLGLFSNTSDILHPDDPKYNDRLATLLEGNRELSAEELKQLGIRLDRDLKLTVGLLVETNGTATVLPNTTKVQSGNITADVAERLAKKIIQQWKFQPTLMQGKEVPRAYYLPITISPIKK